ncbi:hypothetical protein [Verrucomicrobium spinosum]|uniref:hypothetical protein n=1 Tax=Verrucomicrobium spinosum TaxID=2736 RepID=UPI0031B56BB9
MDQRLNASYEDVRAVAPAVLRHRLLLDYGAKLEAHAGPHRGTSAGAGARAGQAAAYQSEGCQDLTSPAAMPRRWVCVLFFSSSCWS